jgi:cytoskeletal protein CcmA (bactofilin family)
MLRIGKNPKDQDEHETTIDKPEISSYSTPKTYPSFQGTSVEPKSALESSATARAVTESESLARDIKEGTLGGFVGSGTVVTGEATFKAMMRVDGHLSGRISSSSGTLIVGANGRVDANIEVAVAMIHGTVHGDIIATQRLELGRAAKMNGNIQTPSLMIEQGAIFEGSCKMMQMNASKDKVKDKKVPEEKPLDATGMRPINADSSNKSPEITNVSNVAS